MYLKMLNIETVKDRERFAAIKNIRIKVFQEEQGVAAELEFDGLDNIAIQLLAYLDGKAVGTARIREINTTTAKIERLAILPEARRKGIGKKLMQSALQVIDRQQKTTAIVHAQAYISQLYRQLGFEIVGEQFSEAGIAHVKMVKQLS